MVQSILKCKSCNNYTLKEVCPKCGGEAITCRPAKYSPEDKYASYRRQAKKEQLQKEGLI